MLPSVPKSKFSDAFPTAFLFSAKTPEEIVPALGAAKTSGAAAVNVLATRLFFQNRRFLFDRARQGVATLALHKQGQEPTRPNAKPFLGAKTCPASDLLYSDRERRQCGRQEPGPVVEIANGDGRHETAHQETDKQTQRLSQMIGAVVVQCATAF